MTVRADRDLFGRLVVAADARTINLKEVLSYELSVVPFALAHSDGMLRKSAKSVLMSELEKDISSILRLAPSQQTTAVMFDGMALVQMLKTGNTSTFGDLAKKHFDIITSGLGNGCNRVDVVFDQYRTTSIKSEERERRGTSSAIEVKIYGQTTPIPKQWPKYISNVQNKVSLCAFLSSCWIDLGMEKLVDDQQLILAGGFRDGERAVVVTGGQSECIEALTSDHEEADTRLLLHAKHAAESVERIIIQSPDTDVAVMCASHYDEIGCTELWFKTGTKDKTRYIQMHDISRGLGKGLCTALIGLHALTGCDSTSALSGIGKKKGLHALRKEHAYCDTLSQIGVDVPVNQDVMAKCEEFVCGLYTTDSKAGKSADSVRHYLFCQKGQRNENLPPTTDSLSLHVQRANYQSLVWRSALNAKQGLPSPDGLGWENKDDVLRPVLMTKAPAPTGLIELTSCRCKKSFCRRTACVCRSNGQPCIKSCMCMSDDNCENPHNATQTSDSDDSD
jgi:hypothetical protein